MKIKYLEMQAFGPFLTSQKVNFERLNEAELFLITGATGAGKTTIFDAICFALYGESSGEIREPSYFRNQQASDDVLTYVRLIFEVHGNVYDIRREPSYPRQHYKTAHPASVALVDGDKVYTGKAEVASRMVAILGVEASQFRQVAMLAQGGFDKLIRASTKEKEKIFRELFSTHIYQTFQEDLKKEQKAREEDYNQYQTALNIALENYQGEKEVLDYLKNEIAQHEREKEAAEALLKNTAGTLETLTATLEHALHKESLQQQLISNQEQKKALDEQKEAITSKKQQINALMMVKEVVPLDLQNEEKQHHLCQLEKQKEGLQRKLYNAKNAYDLIQEKQPHYEENKERWSVIKQEKKRLEDDLNRLMNYTKAEQKYQHALRAVDESKIKLHQLHEEKEALELQINQEKDHLMSFSQIESLTSDIHHLSQAVKELQENHRQALKYQKQYDENHQALVTSKTHYEALCLKQRQLADLKLSHEQSYRLNLAGILASKLEDGMPCPVCGSISHPHKAELSSASISEDILKQDQEHLDQMDQDVRKALETYAYYDKHDQALQVLLDQYPLAQCEKVYNEKKQELMTKKDTCHQLQLAKETHEKNLVTLKKQYQTKQETWTQANQDVELEEEKLKIAQTTFLALKGSFKDGHVNANDLMKQLSSLNREERPLLQAIEQFERTQNDAKTTYTHLSGQYETLGSEYERAKEAASISEATFKQALPMALERYQMLKKEVSSLESLEKEVKAFDEQYYAIIHAAIELKNKLDSLEAPPSEQLKKQIKELQDQRDQAFVQIETSKQKVKAYRQDFVRIDVGMKELKIAEEKYQEINDLYQLVSGNNRLKLSFETYILSVYFDAIIERANLRMVEMTNGRYVMSRKEAGGGRGLQGLELEVLDYESGKKRDIKTLSGGETFKASLSLALGLADLVSENTGGVVLDTLFIDEGFGSLDPLSLDLAIDTLLNLKQDRKVIGIISHVPALSERIETRIEVGHTKESSFIKIHS